MVNGYRNVFYIKKAVHFKRHVLQNPRNECSLLKGGCSLTRENLSIPPLYIV